MGQFPDVLHSRLENTYATRGGLEILKSATPGGGSINASGIMATKGDQELWIRAPDDFHVHLRDGAMMTAVAPFTAQQFRRALVMPNLHPPIRNVSEALLYRKRIMSGLSESTTFDPLMTLYLTDNTSPQDILEAKASGFVLACKLYPAGATTNSEYGVTSLEKISSVLTTMESQGMVLCVHGEVVDSSVDVFDREAEFVKQVLPILLQKYAKLKIVLEHITTKEAVALVLSTPGYRLAATITPHHLMYSRNAIFAGAKLHPHMFCLPVLKREFHRQALLAALLNDERGLLFAGTDSAPHPRTFKECESGCAGIFCAPVAVQLYAESFEEAGALDRLQAFLSENGARFYGLSLNKGTICLRRHGPLVTLKKSQVPDKIVVPGENDEYVIPLRAGEHLPWTLEQ